MSSSTTTQRDAAFEVRWLMKAEDLAQPMLDEHQSSGWMRRVMDRLGLYGLDHPETWPDRLIEELLQEMREEGLDLGGWGVLAAQKVAMTDMERLPEYERSLILSWIQRAAAHGAAADGLLRRALLKLPEGL